MHMKPLAYRIRPKAFEDIVGQDHLVGPKGVITKMLASNQLCSLILYGPAGCGKTSIAEIIASHYSLNSYNFNASCDNKAKLKDIAEAARLYDNVILIIDEILAVGDYRFQEKCQERISRLMGGSTTVLLVSHSTDTIKKFCNRAAWLENGELKAIGMAEDICDQYEKK